MIVQGPLLSQKGQEQKASCVAALEAFAFLGGTNEDVQPSACDPGEYWHP
ncbi:hypothetical protein GbCGDNIH4_8214 [Granulibacter bethesdensis CGDNIH4]|nr:hypothetical protein GbCGDNIH4_8214 [Granulibacter bethesdensis CGDNIH4]